MSIASILSGLTGTSSHAAFSTRSVTSTASEELQKLFSKLHMDAIASASTSTSATTGSAATSTGSTTTSSSGGAVTDIVHSLRHILDGGIAVAKEARTAAKTAASVYTHGGGVGALASQVVDKLG